MATSDVTLGEITNELLVRPDIRQAAFITVPTTGDPTLDRIKLRFARHAVALKYSRPAELDDLLSRWRAAMDLVVADPPHGYDDSVHGLECCLQLLRPGGILLCHDCVPPPWMATSEQPSTSAWCGVTFAAFRDVMTAHGIPWCTLATDFGLGLAVVSGDGVAPGDTPSPQRWTAESHDAYLGGYCADPFGFMRAVRPDQWRVAIDRLREGSDLGDIAARFGAWADLLPLRPQATRLSPLRRILHRVRRTLLGRARRG